MQSVMQMLVARFTSRNPCILRLMVLPKSKGDALCCLAMQESSF